jgi:DNA-binding transcriptional ArsR family regulator
MNAVATRSDDDLDAMFAALADPTRRSIVAHLTRGDATVNELAAPFAMSVQAVSRHIQVLERSGLISRGRHRQTRPCRLEPEALRAATEWIDRQRQEWSDRFDRLDQHLEDLQSDTRSAELPGKKDDR